MRLVLMGDFHYSLMEDGTEEMKEARDKVYSAMLHTFVNTEGHFHISLGDLTHRGIPDEFRYVVDRIGSSECKFIHVLGNHDAISIPKTDILAITGQKRYSSIDTEEAILIFLDSTKEMNETDWGGEIDQEQLDWLQTQLELSGEKPVFIFSHHPVYGTTALSTVEKMSIHPDIDMKAVLHKKQGPGIFFCGHNHVNSIVQQDGWYYIQTPALLDIPALRIVECKDGQVTIKLVTMDDAELKEQISSFITKMSGFTPSAIARGDALDCTLQVTVKHVGIDSVKA